MRPQQASNARKSRGNHARWGVPAAAVLAALGGLALAGPALTAVPEPPARPLAVATRPAALEAGYDRGRRFVGRVEFAQASAVSFELGGKVAEVRVEEGDRVEAGQVLATLDTARLEAQRAELVAARREARAEAELARIRDRRARELLREDVISPQQADDARLAAAARAAAVARVAAAIERVDVDLAKAALRAPFAGEVSVRHVDAGVVVETGQPVLRVLETARPEVRVGVTRDVAAGLRDGATLAVRIHGEVHTGRVLAVLRERGRDTRTVPVRLEIEERSGALREGDLAELVSSTPVQASGFWLPRAALTEGARGLWVVYVAAPEADGDLGRLERRSVEVLHESGDRVFVRGAVRAGEPVVQAGVHRLVPGQHVQLAPVSAPLALAAPAEPIR